MPSYITRIYTAFSACIAWVTPPDLFWHTYSHRRFEQLVDPAAPKAERTSAPDKERANEAGMIDGPTLDDAAKFEAANSDSALRGPKCAPASCSLSVIGRLTTQATDRS